MRVDAALVALAAALATTLLLHLYARLQPAYSGAYACYSQALSVALNASAKLGAGAKPSPPAGWLVEVLYPNGTLLRYGSLARERCRAYTIAPDGALVVARG